VVDYSRIIGGGNDDVEPWYVSNLSIIFDCSMLLYCHSWMFYNHFIATLYHFLGLTYWHSAQCQLLFFACFLHRRKLIPNGVQTQRNFLVIFSGQEDIQRAREVPERGPEVGSTHHGAPGGPGAPWWVVLPSEPPSGTFLAQLVSSGPEKIT
jgi:hypothetical protein